MIKPPSGGFFRFYTSLLEITLYLIYVGVLNHIDGKGFWTEQTDGETNNLIVDGAISGQRNVITNVTGDLVLGSTVRSSSIILVNAVSGLINITLPNISGVEGFQLTIKKIDTTSNNVVIQGVSSQLIDGDASKTITEPYTSVTLISSNDLWWIL